MSDQIPPAVNELPPSPTPAPAPKGGRGARLALIIGIAVVLLGGAAGAAGYLFLRGAPEAVLDKVPASADVVVVAHLDPAASQKMNLFRMAEKFPALGSREELTRLFNDALDGVLSGSGLSHEDLSWVGGEAGGYVDIGLGTPTYAIMFATDDEAAANAAMQRMRDASHAPYSTTTIDGVEVAVSGSSNQPAMAIVDGVAVFASDENAMREVISTAGGDNSIQDDPVFAGVSDRLPEDNLGFAFVNVEQVTELLNSIPGVLSGLPSGTEQLAAAQGVGFSVSADSDGLALDSVTTTDPAKLTQEQRDAIASSEDPNALLDLVPADAYAVSAFGGVTAGLEQSIEQAAQLAPREARMLERLHLIGPDGVLTHLTGDLAVQAGPATGLLPIGGSVLIGVDDADAVRAWLDENLQGLIADANPLDLPGGFGWKTEEYNGVTITYANALASPVPVAYGVVDGALVIATSAKGVEQAVDLSQAGGGIVTDPGYSAAVAGMPGTESVMYIDVQGILTAVQGFLPGDAYEQFLEAGGDNLEPITAVVAGSETDESGGSSRLLIHIP